ncbi:MAG: hypothetical protein R2748_17125 [Bryobacterales bacterium]
MNRRDALRWVAGGSAANLTGLLMAQPVTAAPTPQADRGMAPVKITDVKAILTAPPGLPRTVVVKIETDQPGLYGWGCATVHPNARRRW